MLDVLRNHLPSGLATIEVDGFDEEWVQRTEYPFVLRTKVINAPSAPISRPSLPERRERVKKEHAEDMILQIVRHVDVMFDMYNDRMRREAIARFIENMRRFIGQNPGLALVGRKGSREIMAYLSRTDQVPPLSFFKICSFLLDARIHVHGQVYEWNNVAYERDIHLKN